MTTPVKIGEYKYCYGTSNEANREMCFLRYPDGRIQASVYALFPKKVISTVPTDHILVEMQTTSQKMQNMMALRKKDSLPFPGPSEKPLGDLPTSDQNDIINKLEPRGPWRIEITNDFGKDPRFENVVDLSFFNPQ